MEGLGLITGLVLLILVFIFRKLLFNTASLAEKSVGAVVDIADKQTDLVVDKHTDYVAVQYGELTESLSDGRTRSSSEQYRATLANATAVTPTEAK